MNENELQDWRKKLLFRAWHRGTRELDIMIGRFAEAAVPGFGATELAQFEELMKENDPDFYDWIIGKTAPPENVNNAVLEKLIAFYK